MPTLALCGGEKTVTEPAVWPEIGLQEEEAVLEVIRSKKWFRYEGTKNEEFEKKFADYCGTKYGLTVTNGTAAIEIPLAVSGIGQGDELIVPSYTFFSTASAVAFVGATPVFCDVDPDSYNMDLDHVETLINDRTRAIIPVHFAGFPVDMDRLNAIAKKHKLMVIEDCAHAHGAEYNGKKVGSLSDASTFSFQASKNLSSGEGGLMLTSDDELYQKMFTRHTCGRKIGRPWYEHHAIGSNLRLSEMQAALLLAQFERLEPQLEQRNRNAAIIEAAIEQIPFLTRVQRHQPFSTRRTYHIFMLRYNPGIEGVSRETFIEALIAEGVTSFGGYPVPLYMQPAFESIPQPKDQGVYNKLSFPGVEQCCRESVWITHPHLLGDESRGKQVVRAIEKIVENADELRTFQKALP